MSLNLNPIENIWHESAIREHNLENIQKLMNDNDYKISAKKEWEKISAEKCKKPTDDYKKRLEIVIAAKERATKYFKGLSILLPM